MSAEVHIDGLKEFRQGLRELDRDLPKALRLAFNDAADLVVDDARPRIPRRSGRARRSLRVASTQKRARVRLGGAKAVYAPWLDFGGRVGRNRSVRRPFLKEGRYVYRSYFKLKGSGEFQEALERGLVKVAKDAGVEVT